MKYLRLGFAFAVVATVSASAQAQESDLMVEQSAVEQSDADTDVTFSVTVTNLGPDASDAVTLSDPLPLGMTFVSVAAAAGWNCTTPAVGNGGNVDCTVGTLAVGTPASFSIVAHIDAAAEAGTYFTNVVTASTATDPSGENDAAVATVQTPPPPSADVGVLVTGPAATNPDLDVSYVIEVINGGPEAASNVALGTALAGDMVFVSLQQESGPTFSCTTGATIDCTIASLAAGASAELTLVGHVPAGTTEGTTYQLFAYVSSDYDPNTENDQSPTLVCVQDDSCVAGACNANVAVVCVEPDQCHEAATCDPVSGACSPHPAKADGEACDDGDACTQTDDCQAGTCTGANPVVCPVADQCEDQGTCDSATGVCGANTQASDGTSCDDDDDCTRADACSSGSCEGELRAACVEVDAGEAEDEEADAGGGTEPGTPDAGTAGSSGPDAGAPGAGGTSAAGSGSGPEVDAGGTEDAGADAGAGGGGGDGDCSCRAGMRRSRSASSTIALALCAAGLLVTRAARVRRKRARTSAATA